MTLLAGLGVGRVALMLVYWLCARAVGPAEFGPITAVVGVAMMIVAVADFGLNSLTIRDLSRSLDDVAIFKRTLGAKTALAVVLGVGWSVICAGFQLAGAGSWPSTALGAYIFLRLVGSTFEIPFRSMQRLAPVVVEQAVQGSVSVVAVAVLLRLDLGAAALPPALALGMVAGIVVLVVSLPAAWRGVPSPPTGEELYALWKSAWSFGLSSVAAQLQRADTALVAAVAGPLEAGVFAIPARLTGPLGLIPTAFSSALLPEAASGAGSTVTHHRVLRAGGVVLAVMTVLLGVLFVAAPLLPKVIGPAYADSIPVLRVYLPGMLLASTSQPLAVFLQAEGQETFVGRIVAMGVVAGLAATAMGGWLAGALGAAWGFIVVHTFVVTVLGTRVAKLVRHGGSPVPVLAGDGHADP
jgi:O-antigen/teichoic acid export membrane protein